MVRGCVMGGKAGLGVRVRWVKGHLDYRILFRLEVK